MSIRARQFSFPSAYTVLMLVIVVCAGITWVLPAGRFDLLKYDQTRRLFVAEHAGSEETLPADQATLDRLGIRIRIENFENGNIRKPVSIPGTYHQVPPNRQGFIAILKAPMLGMADAFEVILFVLVIGGFIGVFNASGAFATGIDLLVKRLRGREAWLIAIVTTAISIGGTTFGMAEETFAFFPLLVPMFLAAGYDRLVPVAVIFIGSSIGTMISTTNPFSTIIASNAAGISWTAGLTGRLIAWLIATGLSIAYIIRYAHRERRDSTRSLAGPPGESARSVPAAVPELHGHEARAHSASPGKTRLLLALFGATFALMIYGVSRLGWWFPEMTTLFFSAALLAGVIDRPGEKTFVATFLAGARDLLGVGLIVGLARGATILLERGEMSGTILQFASIQVGRMPGVPFIVTLLFVYMVLGVFIQSSSGMAVLTMPIMSALADVAGAPREQIVNAYLLGQGLMSFVVPTGLLLPSLAMVDVRYDQWLRFIWPLFALLVGLAIAFLAFGVLAT